ncbi:unnamed protein product [Pedinophyceae sp. YPF-701]|nr:unnamed protein product [Pedinophyceae sp. YPF-701]
MSRILVSRLALVLKGGTEGLTLPARASGGTCSARVRAARSTTRRRIRTSSSRPSTTIRNRSRKKGLFSFCSPQRWSPQPCVEPSAPFANFGALRAWWRRARTHKWFAVRPTQGTISAQALEWTMYEDWKRELFSLPAEETMVDFAFGYLPGAQRAKLLLAATYTFVQHHRPIMAHSPEWLGGALNELDYVDRHSRPDAGLIDGRTGQVALVSRSDYKKFRAALVKHLGKVARVDCPSRVGKNMPSLDEQGLSKIDFFRKYLFCAVPENIQSPGYVSEKLFDAALAGCIPIYAGDVPPEPHVFNPDRIIFARTMDKHGAEDVAAQVEALLNDREALEAKFALPIFRPGASRALTAMSQDTHMIFDAAVRLVLLRKLEQAYAH